MLDSKRFSEKPTPDETKSIQFRMKTSDVEIELQELATKLSQGCTFKPALLNGSKSKDWIQQQLFALDFDGDTTIDEQLNRCKELNIFPAFGYTSFSHTDSIHKFRLVFCNNEVVNDPLVRCKLQYTLINVFDKSDMVTFDATRLFYGGRTLICNDYNLFDGNKIIEDYYRSDYDVKVFQAASAIRPDSDEYRYIESVERKGVCNNNSRYSITYLIPLFSTDTPGNNNIAAFQNRDSEYLKKVFNLPAVTVTNNSEYMDLILKYDLAKILEINDPSSFKCLFHDDNNPSAQIYQCLFRSHATGNRMNPTICSDNIRPPSPTHSTGGRPTPGEARHLKIQNITNIALRQ